MNISDLHRRVSVSVLFSNEFIFTVKSDNTGTSASNQFTIPTTTTGNTVGFNYDITTSDGYTATGVTGNHTITFPSGAGFHTVRISGVFPRIFFNNGGDRLKFLELKNFGIYGLGSTNQQNAFRGCSNMTITAEDVGHFENVSNFISSWDGCSSLTYFPIIDTGNATSFSQCWRGCSSLTSFPMLETKNVTSFSFGWQNCSSLTSFPLLDTSNSTSFSFAWDGCSSLTSFPPIDTSNATAFNSPWAGCSSLTSFPLLNTSKGGSFPNAWNRCFSLSLFPSNSFDNNIANNYTASFNNTNLTTQSIDNILISLNISGVNNGTFSQGGGQAPSATGESAIDSLRAKGWTVTVTGGY